MFGIKAKARKSAGKASHATAEPREILPEKLSETLPEPSPNPMTNIVLADLALRGGDQLLRHAVERTILKRKYGADKAERIVKGRSMAQSLIGTALVRVATRSVPGAIVVGGGLLAKALYDRRRGRKARQEGEKAVEEQASRA